jgi:hypothetical protein
MKKSILRIIFIVGVVVFILFQILIRYNTSLLMTDLNEGIWHSEQRLPHSKDVQILTETAKEFGSYKNAYDNSFYYMLGAVILLILFILVTRQESMPYDKKQQSSIR